MDYCLNGNMEIDLQDCLDEALTSVGACVFDCKDLKIEEPSSHLDAEKG